MSADLDQMLAALNTDADRVRLAPAGQLRAAGDVRTRRRFIATTGTLVAVVAILIGAGVAVAGYRPRSMPEPMPIGSAPTVSSTPPPSTSSSPSSSAPPSSSASASTSSGSACAASSLVYDRMDAGGAMGSVYFTYTFHNGGSTSCVLQGSPDISYVDSGGARRSMPVEHTTDGQPVRLSPGEAVQLVTHEVDGYGGYQTGAPECAHPATYKQAAVVLPGGHVSLGADGTWSVQCGSITVGYWSRPGS
jgi:hypothetical protein